MMTERERRLRKARPTNVYRCRQIGCHFTDTRGDLEVVQLTTGPHKGRYALVTWGSDARYGSAERFGGRQYVETGIVTLPEEDPYIGCETIVQISI